LLAQAKAAYGGPMEIPAVAGFVGGWTFFHDMLPASGGSLNAESIRAAALKVDVPVGDSINGGGVKFAGRGALDEGQNTRAAAVVGQWQAVGVMRVVYPPAFVSPSG
jgi:branched-chain amino acid transport system substrate-binding protein